MNTNQQPPRRLNNVTAAAEYLGVRPATIRHWVWRRQIDTVRIGRCVRIPQEALDRIIERGTTPALEPR
jgi:excisionase family DNA binding protein